MYTTKKLHTVQEKTCRVPIKPRKGGYKNPIAGAQSVSFSCSDDSLSPIYDRSSDASYMSQCFNIVMCIGEGSFGIVYKAKSIEDGKLYAIKKSRDRFRDSWDRKRKLTEVEKFERLSQHPQCVRLYKAWEEDGYLFIQMELCDYSLSKYTLSHHDISEEMVWNVLTDIALALKHLHDNDIMHMDVKLDNILIAKNGSFKLGDFGIAIDCSKRIKDVIDGDPKYIAPEVMDDHFTKSADIFSLGISLLELSYDLNVPVCGVLWHRLRQGAIPDLNVGISQHLLHLIKWMMHPSPDRRPTVDMILREPKIKTILVKRMVGRICHCIVTPGKKLISVLRFFGNVGYDMLMSTIQKLKKVKQDTNVLDLSVAKEELESSNFGIVTSTPASRMTMEYSRTPSRVNESWEISEQTSECNTSLDYESHTSAKDIGTPELKCRCRVKRRKHPYQTRLVMNKCSVCSGKRRGTARNLFEEYSSVDPIYKED